MVKEVDVRDCSEIIAENYKQATLFGNVQGYNSQLIANAMSSRKMIALALDTEETNILSEYASRIAKPIPPKFASTSKGARCQEEILAAKESEVDLTTLPILLQHEFDGAPYISAGMVVAKDPETGEYNIGIYRLMFRKVNELGINITAPHRLRWFYQKAYEKGKPQEVAVCLGLHALDYLAAVTTSPEGVDELAVWGGLAERGDSHGALQDGGSIRAGARGNSPGGADGPDRVGRARGDVRRISRDVQRDEEKSHRYDSSGYFEEKGDLPERDAWREASSIHRFLCSDPADRAEYPGRRCAMRESM